MKEEQDRKNYKSPKRKLVKFFEKSRDKWKTKHQEVKKNVKQLKNRVNYLEQSKKDLKLRVKELESKLSQIKKEKEQEIKKKDILKQKKHMEDSGYFKIKPACHHYSVDHMTLFINMVLLAAASLRCASRVIKIIVLFLKFSVDFPSWHAGRLWLLRLGLYKLTRPKVKANDWVWIVDHTIQVIAQPGYRLITYC